MLISCYDSYCHFQGVVQKQNTKDLPKISCPYVLKDELILKIVNIGKIQEIFVLMRNTYPLKIGQITPPQPIFEYIHKNIITQILSSIQLRLSLYYGNLVKNCHFPILTARCTLDLQCQYLKLDLRAISSEPKTCLKCVDNGGEGYMFLLLYVFYLKYMCLRCTYNRVF